jgi:pimeloyl-ACP methyl ester carboxylesterase
MPADDSVRSVLLIHGGLWEDIGGDWFWGRTGVSEALTRRGLTVIAPDRLRRGTSWAAEAAHIASAPLLPDGPLTVVGGSFGCAVAVRLALDFPERVGRLVLAWPASTADQFAAVRFRSGVARLGATPAVLDALFGTGTLPSATDAELGTLSVPVGILPSVPSNPLHPRAAADALLRLLPSAVELPGCPEPPRPAFAPHLEPLADELAAFACG